MAFCTACGALLKAGLKFCTRCGKATGIFAPRVAAAAVTSPPRPVEPPQRRVQPIIAERADPAAAEVPGRARAGKTRSPSH